MHRGAQSAPYDKFNFTFEMELELVADDKNYTR
jgi:hypothetical protein